MAEGVVSRAFIMSNMASTSQATIRAISRTIPTTIKKFESVTETEFTSVIEQSHFPEAGPQLFQYSLNEPTTSVGEGLARQALKVRALSETKSISEALVKKATHLIAEPAQTIGEGLARIKKAVRPISEPAKSVGESLIRQSLNIRTVSEPANTIGESIAEVSQFPRTISEPAKTIGDSVVKVAKKVKTIVEVQINITEALEHARVTGIGESPVSIFESLAASRIFTKVLAEGVFVAGSSLSRSFAVPSFTSTSFLFPLSEVLARLVLHNLVQTTIISENLDKIKRKPRTLSENVSLTTEQLQRLVNHVRTENISVIDALVRVRRPLRDILETTTINDGITPTRVFKRQINPTSFTESSFTTAAFESFNTPSQDVVTITEELEAFVLGQGVKSITEPDVLISEYLSVLHTPFNKILPETVIISDSLDAVKISIPTTGGGGANRRRIRRARYNAYLKTLQPIKTPIPEPEPEHEPLLFEVQLTEPPIAIQESLTALVIRKEKVIVSVAAAAPPPRIIEKTVYVDRIREKEKLVEIQPPPIIRAQDVIVSKPKPIEIEQEILVSTQSHSNRMKSKAASAKLQLLEKLMMMTEMEELV